jgi:hypothetical protein
MVVSHRDIYKSLNKRQGRTDDGLNEQRHPPLTFRLARQLETAEYRHHGEAELYRVRLCRPNMFPLQAAFLGREPFRAIKVRRGSKSCGRATNPSCFGTRP